jgi:RNA polymerase sigma-70 factor (ECF subfamily)
MGESLSFDTLLQRVRAGDQDAAAELVRVCGQAIRDAVRRRLERAGLTRVLDSEDISQSVLKSFFVRAAAGQYELDTAEDLRKLLVRMARNKVVDEARKYRSARRDQRRVTADSPEELALPVDDTTPSQQLAYDELFQKVQGLLSPEERQLAELRNQGRGWADIAAALGGTPQARRKQLARALKRVVEALERDEASRS